MSPSSAVLRRAPGRGRIVALVVGVQLLVASLMRGIFAVVFWEGAGATPLADLSRAVYLGFKFDLRLALLLSLPFVVLSWIPVLDPTRRAAGRRIWIGYFIVVQVVALVVYLIDFGHYAYLGARLDAGILEHLRPISIAMEMLWESYPVVWGALAVAALGAGYGVLIATVAFRPGEATRAIPAGASGARRWRHALVAVAATLVYAFGLYGNWSWYPLRWSAAFFSPSAYVSALGLNPILFFVDTLPNREPPFDAQKTRAHYEEMARYLEVQHPDPTTLSFARYTQPSSRPPGRPNLVLIHLESFAAFKTGILGNRLDPTPAFDAIARDSILFTRFFTPVGATARAVFGLVTGIPDLNPVDTASRNPRIVSQHTLISALDGYEKFYFLGGSAAWGNIRGLLAHNIDRLTVYEEGDYAAPREDSWGVSDLAMFEQANAVLTQQTEPFFAFIQTAGNHRPYTMPQHRGTFEPMAIEAGILRENDFHSIEAFNGIRLLDYSLGRFFDLAREQAYFTNTIFVLYGDHGMHAVGRNPWQELRLLDRWVPLAFYAPGLIGEGRHIDTVASLVDVLPTALGLMGIPYLNTTFGRDLLVPRPAERQFAMANDGVVTNEFLLRVDPRGRSRLHRYGSDTATVDVSPRYPEETVALRRLHDAIRETARYMLYHNPPRPHAAPAIESASPPPAPAVRRQPASRG